MCTIEQEVLKGEKGLKMSKYQFVVYGVYAGRQEEKPLFILTEYDEINDNEKLLFRVLKNERALKLEKVSSFVFWFVLGSAIMPLGIFLADFFGIFKASSGTYLSIFAVFSFLLITNIFLHSISYGKSSFFLTKLFDRDDFFTVKEYAPEYFDNWMITVTDFEEFKSKNFRESKSEKESPAENYINNVLILAYMRKKNRGRKITPKWEDLIADKDEKYLEFTVDKATNF